VTKLAADRKRGEYTETIRRLAPVRIEVFMRSRYVFSLLLLLPSWAHAFDGRLLLADGSPASGYRVSLVGQTSR
jgi:hypothetical protein